jgi:hypothetical protein
MSHGRIHGRTLSSSHGRSMRNRRGRSGGWRCWNRGSRTTETANLFTLLSVEGIERCHSCIAITVRRVLLPDGQVRRVNRAIEELSTSERLD